MTQARVQELRALFDDPAVLTVVGPLIDELADIEDQLQAIKKEPFIRYHPTNRAIQKATPAGRLYKDLLSKQADIARLLLRQLGKGGDDEDSPLREYLRSLA